MDDILTMTLETVIQVLLPIILALVAAVLYKYYQKVKVGANADQVEFIEMIVRQLILSAEQTGLKDALLKEGEAKKVWVIEQATKALAAKGIKIDLAYLSTIIEKIVYEEFTTWKKLDEPSPE
jgi:hypothetical protein